MNWRAWTQIVSCLWLGGVGSDSDAARKPWEPEFGGLMMLGSFTNVTTVSTTRIRAAPTVQPISSGVLPWIWAATRLRLARNLITEYSSAPSTPTNTTAAMYRMIL